MPSGISTLHLRMIAACFGLALVTLGFVVGVWAVFAALFAALAFDAPALLALGPAGVTLFLVGVAEYTQQRTVEHFADARPVDPEEAPTLYRTTTRMAAQLDVPVPTVAVAERSAPEALVVGYRPEHIHLVLSEGTIDALDTPELEAVIAHELAHVANRDAMVMTAVSVPAVLADGLRSRLAAIEKPGWAVVVILPLGLLSMGVWMTGRAIGARLARVRERAADRVAAEATGSPAALASALRTLDREIAATPEHDLRAVSEVSTLSILPLTPEEPEKVMLGPDGDIEPAYWRGRVLLHRFERWLFTAHPPTPDRVDALAAMERDE